jgi:hypothetical protein
LDVGAPDSSPQVSTPSGRQRPQPLSQEGSQCVPSPQIALHCPSTKTVPAPHGALSGAEGAGVALDRPTVRRGVDALARGVGDATGSADDDGHVRHRAGVGGRRENGPLIARRGDGHVRRGWETAVGQEPDRVHHGVGPDLVEAVGGDGGDVGDDGTVLRVVGDPHAEAHQVAFPGRDALDAGDAREVEPHRELGVAIGRVRDLNHIDRRRARLIDRARGRGVEHTHAGRKVAAAVLDQDHILDLLPGLHDRAGGRLGRLLGLEGVEGGRPVVEGHHQPVGEDLFAGRHQSVAAGQREHQCRVFVLRLDGIFEMERVEVDAARPANTPGGAADGVVEDVVERIAVVLDVRVVQAHAVARRLRVAFLCEEGDVHRRLGWRAEPLRPQAALAAVDELEALVVIQPAERERGLFVDDEQRPAAHRQAADRGEGRLGVVVVPAGDDHVGDAPVAVEHATAFEVRVERVRDVRRLARERQTAAPDRTEGLNELALFCRRGVVERLGAHAIGLHGDGRTARGRQRHEGVGRVALG